MDLKAVRLLSLSVLGALLLSCGSESPTTPSGAIDLSLSFVGASSCFPLPTRPCSLDILAQTSMVQGELRYT